jgi:hypothetical protein
MHATGLEREFLNLRSGCFGETLVSSYVCDMPPPSKRHYLYSGAPSFIFYTRGFLANVVLIVYRLEIGVVSRRLTRGSTFWVLKIVLTYRRRAQCPVTRAFGWFMLASGRMTWRGGIDILYKR